MFSILKLNVQQVRVKSYSYLRDAAVTVLLTFFYISFYTFPDRIPSFFHVPFKRSSWPFSGLTSPSVDLTDTRVSQGDISIGSSFAFNVKFLLSDQILHFSFFMSSFSKVILRSSCCRCRAPNTTLFMLSSLLDLVRFLLPFEYVSFLYDQCVSSWCLELLSLFIGTLISQ